MSFRFVATAVGILGASFAGSSLMTPAPSRSPSSTSPHTPAALVVPHTPPGSPPQPPRGTTTQTTPPVAITPPVPVIPAGLGEEPPRAEQRHYPRYIVATNDLAMPKVWVGVGGHYNPLNRELTRDEEETGWADGPEFLGRELISGLGVVPIRRPNPDVLVVPGIDIGPDRGRGAMIIPKIPRSLVGPNTKLAPSVELEPLTPGRQSELPGWAVHIASYKTQPAAAQGWKVLSSQHPTLLNLLVPSYASVTIPGRGPFVRLMAGRFASRTAAQDACGPLVQAGLYCQVVGAGMHARL